MVRSSILAALVLSACIVAGGAASGATLVFKEMAGNEAYTYVFRLEPSEGGFLIDLSAQDDPTRDEFETDDSFSVLTWRRKNAGEGTEFTASRQGNRILVAGRLRGKAVYKEHKTSTVPWKQLFPMGFEKFVTSTGKTLEFVALNPADLAMYTFVATKKETKKDVVDGKEIELLHVRVTLSGLLAPFWHGDAWHRRRDGRCIRYETVKGLTAPLSVTEFISETDSGQ